MTSEDHDGDAAPPAAPPAGRAAPLAGDLTRTAIAALPRRFYSTVAVATVATDDGATGHTVHLDGRPIKSPGKRAVVVPVAAIADMMAAEWAAQSERIDPSTMPVTRLVNSTIDTVMFHAETLREEIVAYAGSDALCYRADAPTGLVERQIQAWNPLLAWAERYLDARFVTTVGIIHSRQPDATLAAVRIAVAGINPWRLAPVHMITTLTGSAVLALAVAEGEVTFDAVWRAANVDEDWQIALWGEDAEAAARRARLARDTEAAVRVLSTFR
jgi:chaperone required for assembly of F1-ATPase